MQKSIECWGMFEFACPGRTDGNPFTDYEIHGIFSGEKETVRVAGFYDGAGVYKVRFMPSWPGTYRYTVSGSFSEETYQGQFLVTEPSKGNHSRPWITHCSIQRQDVYRTSEYTDQWRAQYRKPVVLDEIAYEGNIQHGWGNISGEELIRRFWEGAVRGGYPGHGETFMNEKDILWWSHGGQLRGESWKRVGFLLDILKAAPGCGLRRIQPFQYEWDSVCAAPEDRILAEKTGYRLYYYSFMRPSFREFQMETGIPYQVDVIDTWNMTVTDAGVHEGRFRIALPGTAYMAIRMYKVNQ